MKKYKKIAYVFLIIIVAITSVLLYRNISKGSESNSKEKGNSEIEFLEAKLQKLLNGMNNIETRNYSVSVSEISKQTKSQKSQSSSSGGQSPGSSSESGSESGSDSGSGGNGSSNGGGGSGGASSEGGGDSSSQGTETGKKYSLKSAGILTNSSDIDWTNTKSEIENLYSSIPTITIDLYGLNVAQEDVLGFNKEFDKLTVAAKSENKEQTLSELSKLYEYIPKFMDKTSDAELDKTIAKTKSDIFKAYSKLDSKNWEEISKDTKQAVDTYSKLLTNTNIDKSKQYDVSKGYVMLNELQNAVDMKDESVFLIKYENLLEEIDNI